jgi:DNA-binding CsgD family transcriptional regulator
MRGLRLQLGPGISQIARDLLASATAGEFLRAVVHNQLAYVNAIGAYLSTINEDGFLEIQHSYGFDGAHMRPGESRSIWSKSATTDAIRNRKILVYQSRDQYLADFPELEASYVCSQIVSIPIWARGVPVGAITLGFDFQYGPIPDENDDLWLVYQILGEMLLSPPTWIFELSRQVDMWPEQNSADAEREVGALTGKEVEILELISKGLTNKEIAQTLSYSDSFIGKANIELFKKLGASKRRDAVRIAVAKGLIRP